MLFLKKADYDIIIEHALSKLPQEACGLITGTEDAHACDNRKYVQKVYLLRNTDESNEHFSMDPKEQLAVIKDSRTNGFKILGNFHSHPESPSRLSEEDKRLVFDLDMNYLIVSLMDPDKPVLKAFTVDGNKDTFEEAIEVI